MFFVLHMYLSDGWCKDLEVSSALLPGTVCYRPY